MGTTHVSIASFMTKLKKEALFLGHQFQVTIPGIDDVQLFATGTSVPARTLNVIDVPYVGHNFKIPGTVDYGGEWSCTLRLSNNGQTRKQVSDLIAVYANLAKNGGGQKTIPNLNVTIDLLDSELKNVIKTFILVGVFPTTDSAIELTTESADLVNLEISFAFQYFYDEADGDPLK